MKTLSSAIASGHKLTRCMAAVTIAAGALSAHGQTSTVERSDSTPAQIRQRAMIESTHMITAGDDQAARDSLENLLNMFYIDQFRHAQDPRAPYFMFLSKDGKLAMGVGGVIRIRGYYDWNGSIPINGFSPYAIPIPKNPASMRRLAATGAGTGLFLQYWAKIRSLAILWDLSKEISPAITILISS